MKLNPPTDALSEFRRGWIIVVMAAVGLGCGLGAIPIYTLGAFTKPLAETFGWSRAEVQGIYTWMTIGNLMAAPLLGWLIDRHGARRLTLISILAASLGLVALGTVTGPLWSFYLVAFVTSIVGVGTVHITWTRAIVNSFNTSRGLALGCALAGTGAAAVWLPSYVTWLISDYGWRIAYVGLGILPLGLAFPLAYLFLFDGEQTPKTRDVQATQPSATPAVPMAPPRIAIARNYRFWVLILAFFLAGANIAGMITHLIPMMTDSGVSPASAAKLAGIVGVAVIVGRIGTGFLIDRYWAPAVALVLLNLPVISCLILAGQPSGGITGFVAAALIGLAAGAEFDLMSYLVSKYFDQRRYGTIYSWLYALLKLGAGIGAPLFGFSFDRTGSYSLILYFAAAGFLSASLLLLTLGKYRTNTTPDPQSV